MKYCDQCHSTYPTDFNVCPRDQAALRSVAELDAGMVLRGKYEVLGKIGSGGMATVYRVRHLHLNEELALKLVSSRLAEDAGFRERFRAEAVITRRLRHPNAIRLDDFDFTEDGRPFLVMEYVAGSSLRSELAQAGWLTVERAADIGRQVAQALAAAHALGIVHRDIKPENILLVRDAKGADLVKVLDFGIAKVIGGALEGGVGHATRTGLVLGTPQYISPEQARGKGNAEVDGRADLYALGVVLYEMVTGRLPFTADTPFDLLLHHIQTAPLPPHLVNPALNLSPAWSELVLKALAKGPAQRFQSGEEMAEALSDPELLKPVENNGSSAQVFSTAALAAAAAGLDSAAEPEVASVPPQATAPMGSRTSAGTLPLGRNTEPLGSDSAAPAVRTDRLPAPPAPAALVVPLRSRRRRLKWAGAAVLAAGLAIATVLMLQPAPSAAEASAAPPPAVATSPPARSANANRGAKPRRQEPPRRQEAQTDSSRARADELVNLGYRRLERRDFAGAAEAFHEALALDPSNSRAQQGLRVAQTAHTVESVAGVLKR